MSERTNGETVLLDSVSCEADPALPLLVALGRPLLAALATPSAEATAATPIASPELEGVPDESVTNPDGLFSVIETNIIPRLMLLHRLPDGAARAQPLHGQGGATLDSVDHARFLDLVRFGSEPAVLQHVRSLLARGVPRSVVFVELLGGAARELGELWRRDECSFSDVTIGLCRLHMIIREESTLFDVRSGGQPRERRVLMATAAGDQHILGAVLVAEFFRQDGWQVACEPGLSPDGITGLLQTRPFDILGLSLSRSSQAEDMRSEIAAYRKASANPCLCVLVGGQVFEREPDLVGFVGADGACLDARDAPGMARGVIEKRMLAQGRAESGGSASS